MIDTIGILSSVYRYGFIAYVGGGFGKGIHNILEAAVYSIPVIFGPNYSRFREAVDLIKLQSAFCIHSSSELTEVLRRLSTEKEISNKAGLNAGEYVRVQTGATKKIMDQLGI